MCRCLLFLEWLLHLFIREWVLIENLRLWPFKSAISEKIKLICPISLDNLFIIYFSALTDCSFELGYCPINLAEL